MTYAYIDIVIGEMWSHVGLLVKAVKGYSTHVGIQLLPQQPQCHSY